MTDILYTHYFFFQKTGFDISFKFSSLETICMKYQNLFCGKYKIDIINISSAELAQSVAKVNFIHN